MKQDNELRIFLNKYINIDNSRLEKAKGKVNSEDGSLIKFIQNNLSEYFISSSYQWSFSYHTIIKPNKDSDNWQYDVDVAIKLKSNEDFEWDERKYHQLLIDIFEWSERYKDKLDKSKERSIRIQYDANDGEFYVDLVPMFNNWTNRNVINRKDNIVEISWWGEFRDWVNKQNNKTSIEWSKVKFLKEVIRLYKYLRNLYNPDIIRSVQLTLLLARQIDKLEESNFINLSTTFYSVSLKLKEELDGISKVSDLDLSNPWLEEEIFDRNFTNDNFLEFKEWIIWEIEKIELAYNEQEDDKSLSKWQEIFWDDFWSESINKSIIIYDYNHAHKPYDYWWNINNSNKQSIKIVAQKVSKYNWKEAYIKNWERVPNGIIYRFYAIVPEYLWKNTLYWQVTNEWNTFVLNKRWEINNPSRDLWYDRKIMWYWIQEEGKRKWAHWVKCYLLDSNDNVLWESEKFTIKIM